MAVECVDRPSPCRLMCTTCILDPEKRYTNYDGVIERTSRRSSNSDSPDQLSTADGLYLCPIPFKSQLKPHRRVGLRLSYIPSRRHTADTALAAAVRRLPTGGYSAQLLRILTCVVTFLLTYLRCDMCLDIRTCVVTYVVT